MTTQDFEHRLTAILHADVKGYSRLIAEDEEKSVSILTAYREGMGVLIRKHRGRVVHGSGDSLLAEFVSVVGAVRCAVEIQKELKRRNAGLPEDRKVEFRIGINLGDVIEEGEDLHGNGVNIAARIESLADPGGICISRSVYDQVKSKLALGYEYLGEHSAKNIAEPVRVYRVLLEPEAVGKLAGEKRIGRKQGQRVAFAAVIALLLVVGGVALWKSYITTAVPPVEVASVKRMTFPLPDKPSIAVLPFENLSGDPEQDYFSDGITEDLITELSKISGLFVIARHSVYIYKGKVVKVADVGREFGVRYVLEGSVRKANDRVRITAQLVDTVTEGHLWAERYDRELKDIFALQDEVTQKIVASLAVKLTEDEQERLVRKYTDNMEAYDYYLRGLEYFSRLTRDTNILAQQMLKRAIDLDSHFAAAYALLGLARSQEWTLGWSQDPQPLEKAYELAQRAITLDESLPLGHAILAEVYLHKKQHERAIAEQEKAITLSPNDADGIAGLGGILTWAGRPEETIGLVKKAMRLNPMYPTEYLWNLGHAYYLMGRYEEAIETLKRARDRSPDYVPVHAYLTASYSELGQEEEARAEAAEVVRLSPQTPIKDWRPRLPYKDQAVLDRFIEALRKAGMK